MGRIFPISLGQMDGVLEGFQTDETLLAYITQEKIQANKKFTEDVEYAIGYGAGFMEGKNLRNTLKKNKQSSLSFEEKVEFYSFLLNINHKASLKFSTKDRFSENDFLENIQNWDKNIIPKKICQISLDYLNENKLQRASDTMWQFYKENFYLKALKEFYPYSLKYLRNQKKEKSTPDSELNNEIISSNLYKWIKKYEEK